jgi:hypothetical protein
MFELNGSCLVTERRHLWQHLAQGITYPTCRFRTAQGTDKRRGATPFATSGRAAPARTVYLAGICLSRSVKNLSCPGQQRDWIENAIDGLGSQLTELAKPGVNSILE